MKTLRIYEDIETSYIDPNEQRIMFAHWLLFSKVIYDIKHNRELSPEGYIKLISFTTSATDKAIIVMNCIREHYLMQWLNIENYQNIRDLIFFDNPNDYLKQFENNK